MGFLNAIGQLMLTILGIIFVIQNFDFISQVSSIRLYLLPSYLRFGPATISNYWVLIGCLLLGLLFGELIRDAENRRRSKDVKYFKKYLEAELDDLTFEKALERWGEATKMTSAPKGYFAAYWLDDPKTIREKVEYYMIFDNEKRILRAYHFHLTGFGYFSDQMSASE